MKQGRASVLREMKIVWHLSLNRHFSAKIRTLSVQQWPEQHKHWKEMWTCLPWQNIWTYVVAITHVIWLLLCNMKFDTSSCKVSLLFSWRCTLFSNVLVVNVLQCSKISLKGSLHFRNYFLFWRHHQHYHHDHHLHLSIIHCCSEPVKSAHLGCTLAYPPPADPDTLAPALTKSALSRWCMPSLFPIKNAGLRFPLSLWSCVRFSICLGMIFDT